MSIGLIPSKVGKGLSACLYATTLFLTSAAHGALLPRDIDGDGVVDAYYDTALNISWLRDWGASGLRTWDGAVAWAAALNVGGVTGWRLPGITDTGNGGCDFSTAGGTDCGYNVDTHGSEMARLWYVTLGNLAFCAPGDANCDLQGAGQSGWGLANTGPFRNVQAGPYWSGTPYAPDATGAWNFSTNDGAQDFDPKTEVFYAVAVHPGDVAPGPVAYNVFDLTPAGFVASATGVSNQRQVGGGNGHALLWFGDAVDLIDLNPAGFSQSMAQAVVGSRQVGEAITSSGVHRAILWNDGAAGAIDLTPAGFAQGTALGMDLGHQVGRALTAGHPPNAFLWTGSAASAVNLHPAGFTASEAWAVGEGQQAGFGINALDGRTHALLWSGSSGSVVDLHPAGFTDSRATAVSGGQQAGVAFDPGTFGHALLWSGSAANFVDLTLPGYGTTQINAMAGGQQVGYGFPLGDSAPISFISTGGGSHALVWTGSVGSVVDLNAYLPPGFFEASAQGIDDAGNIVGSGTDSPVTFAPHALLWTPALPHGLDITNVGTPDHIKVGDQLTYTVTVSNSRSGTVTGVILSDAIAVGTLVSATPSQGQCLGTVIVQCLFGSLPGNSSANVTIVVQMPQGFFGFFVDNTATVEADDLLIATATEDTPVDATANLAITNTDAPDPVVTGKNVTYTLRVTNPGIFAATNVTVQDTLPAGVNFVSANPSQGSCSGSATVVCNLGSILVGGSAKVTIVVTPTQAGSISNTATVSADQPDPDTNDNSATQNTTVNAAPAADLTGTWNNAAQKCTTRRGKTTCTISGAFRVVNQGAASSPPNVARFYLSTDAALSADDVFVGQLKVSALAVGGSVKLALKLPVPIGVNASGKFLIAVVDSANVVIEANEANNTVPSPPFP